MDRKSLAIFHRTLQSQCGIPLSFFCKRSRNRCSLNGLDSAIIVFWTMSSNAQKSLDRNFPSCNFSGADGNAFGQMVMPIALASSYAFRQHDPKRVFVAPNGRLLDELSTALCTSLHSHVQVEGSFGGKCFGEFCSVSSGRSCWGLSWRI